MWESTDSGQPFGEYSLFLRFLIVKYDTVNGGTQQGQWSSFVLKVRNTKSAALAKFLTLSTDQFLPPMNTSTYSIKIHDQEVEA